MVMFQALEAGVSRFGTRRQMLTRRQMKCHGIATKVQIMASRNPVNAKESVPGHKNQVAGVF